MPAVALSCGYTHGRAGAWRRLEALRPRARGEGGLPAGLPDRDRGPRAQVPDETGVGGQPDPISTVAPSPAGYSN